MGMHGEWRMGDMVQARVLALKVGYPESGSTAPSAPSAFGYGNRKGAGITWIARRVVVLRVWEPCTSTSQRTADLHNEDTQKLGRQFCVPMGKELGPSSLASLAPKFMR
jgi:hypothetical protein